MEYDVDGTTCSLVIYLSEVSLLLQAVTTASLSRLSQKLLSFNSYFSLYLLLFFF